MGSSIHPEHVDMIHKGNYDGIMNFWNTNGPNLDIRSLMNYDPYLGRITENSQMKQKQQ